MNRISTYIIMLMSLLTIACSTGDDKKEVFDKFVHIPEHKWIHSIPCYFKPMTECDKCDIKLSLRHENEYKYERIGLTVDIVDADTVTLRKTVVIPLVDNIGNWTSNGFGSLYQCQTHVFDDVRLDSTSVILVWQSMNCDTLQHISEVGINISRK